MSERFRKKERTSRYDKKDIELLLDISNQGILDEEQQEYVDSIISKYIESVEPFGESLETKRAKKHAEVYDRINWGDEEPKAKPLKTELPKTELPISNKKNSSTYDHHKPAISRELFESIHKDEKTMNKLGIAKSGYYDINRLNQKKKRVINRIRP